VEGAVGMVVMQAVVQLLDHRSVGCHVHVQLEEGCLSLLSYFLVVNLVLFEAFSVATVLLQFCFCSSFPCNIYNFTLGRFS
jgi:hypothetical protein